MHPERLSSLLTDNCNRDIHVYFKVYDKNKLFPHAGLMIYILTVLGFFSNSSQLEMNSVYFLR